MKAIAGRNQIKRASHQSGRLLPFTGKLTGNVKIRRIHVLPRCQRSVPMVTNLPVLEQTPTGGASELQYHKHACLLEVTVFTRLFISFSQI